jgi:hypothetical protein
MEAMMMFFSRNIVRHLFLGFMVVILSGILLLGATSLASAEKYGSGDRSGQRSGQREVMDSRYHHDRSYPMRGHFVNTVPRDHYRAAYGGSRYYFHGGVWYRPEGRRFVITSPAIGLVVPFLPFYYTTIWAGGTPYYYANDVYYNQTPTGYMVVEPPKEEVQQTPPSEGQLFIYPRNGQSEQKQATDRYECHRWAVSQTGYDPTQPAAADTNTQKNQTRPDYQRAMGACLDGRGYTVK